MRDTEADHEWMHRIRQNHAIQLLANLFDLKRQIDVRFVPQLLGEMHRLHSTA